MLRFLIGLTLTCTAVMALPDINGIRNNANNIEADARQSSIDSYGAPLASPIADPTSWSSDTSGFFSGKYLI